MSGNGNGKRKNGNGHKPKPEPEAPPALPSPALGLDPELRRDGVRVMRFALAYVANGGDGSAAAATAGWTKGAKQVASRLIAEPEVKLVIDTLQAFAVRTAMDNALVAKDEVIRECLRILRADLADLFDPATNLPRAIHEIPEHARRAIKTWKVKRFCERTGTDGRGRAIVEECEVLEIGLHDKLTAIARLAGEAGITPQATRHANADGTPLAAAQPSQRCFIMGKEIVW